MATKAAGQSRYSTPEAQSICTHYGRLLNAIQDSELPSLAAYLMSDFVISPEVMKFVLNQSTRTSIRSNELLLAMMAHLEENPGKFEDILKIFDQELPTLRSITVDISETRGKLSTPVAFYSIVVTD